MRPEVEEGLRRGADSARRLGVCPACGREMNEPGYGSGAIADGNFCSLECFANYWYGSAGEPDEASHSED